MSISRNTPHSRRISTPQSNHILPLLSYDHLWPPAPLRDTLWASRARGYIVTLCGYQKLSEAFQDVPEHVRDPPHKFIRIQTSCRFFPNIGLYGLRVSLTFFMLLTYVYKCSHRCAVGHVGGDGAIKGIPCFLLFQICIKRGTPADSFFLCRRAFGYAAARIRGWCII